MTFVVPKLTRSDVRRLLEDQGVRPGKKEDVEFIYFRTGGNIGFLKNLVVAMKRICRTENVRRPDRPVIEAALDHILPQLYRVLIPANVKLDRQGLKPFEPGERLLRGMS